jgi:D-serine deaminase-like pyridoxal phosphate-dependent protein
METPYVLIDTEKLQVNIDAMATFAGSTGIALRPHVKAHKLPEIARMQLKAGAKGVTVAKLSEAEVMFAAGINDILVAYPIVGESKLARAARLMDRGCNLSLLVDSQVGARAISQMARSGGTDVLVKVDSGLGRCGLLPGRPLEEYVHWLCGLPHLNFRGLVTHAGHAYGCSTPSEVAAIGTREGELMVEAAESLRRGGIRVAEVSIGATPTVAWGGKVPGVTEIRPGNYVFYDATQVALGVVGPERCSLTVISTVISRPTANRAVIDAGSKVLALDQGAHGSGTVTGFGLLENPSWRLCRLSEEHGIIEGTALPDIGTAVKIIPNHACTVINLADNVSTSNGLQWQVAARGRVW